jgi:superfamily II DNA or RNA helicase
VPELREYQARAIEGLRHSYRTGHRAPLLVLPTAAGKTVIFSEATRLAQKKDTAALIAVHRRELVRQASVKLTDAGVPHGIIAAGIQPTPEAAVQIASVQTAIRRDIGEYGFVICDEAHHCVATIWRKILDAQPEAKLLGVTAMPSRLDGQGLGLHVGGLFDDLVVGATVTELTEQGWLVPARVFIAKTRLDLRHVHVVAGDYNRRKLADAVQVADLAGDAVGEYRCRANHQPAIAFCVTVEHAQAAALAFINGGYRAAAIHGGMPGVQRDRLIAALSTGEIEVLTSCEILGEGVDVPSIGCAILLRPTRSLAVYLQQVGRGLRPAPGKTHLTVLDLAGNSVVHGLSDEVHDWSLDGAPKRKTGRAPGWVCSVCDFLNPPRVSLCIHCDARRSRHPRELTIDAEAGLVELRRIEEQRQRDLCQLPYRTFLAEPRSRQELEAYRCARGYAAGWVFHVEREQAGVGR